MDFDERKRRYIAVFEQCSDPALAYLRDHAIRFLRTHDLVLAGANAAQPRALLDLASHWLHGAFLFAESGIAVTALDVDGGEISQPAVLRFAQEHGIKLLPCKALNDPVELEAFPTIASTS